MDVMGYFDIILHPKVRMPIEKKKANVQEAHKTFAIYGAIIGLFFGIAIAFVSGLLGVALGAALQSVPIVGALFGLGVLAVIAAPILFAILVVACSFIWYHILTFVAGLLGGKGKFEDNYYLGSRLLWPMVIAGFIISILSAIPLLGGLIQLVWFLYSIYLMVTLISVANNLDMVKSFITLIVPGIIVFLLVMFMVGAAFFAALGAGAAAGAI